MLELSLHTMPPWLYWGHLAAQVSPISWSSLSTLSWYIIICFVNEFAYKVITEQPMKCVVMGHEGWWSSKQTSWHPLQCWERLPSFLLQSSATEQVVSFQMGTGTSERLSNLLEMQSWVSDPGFKSRNTNSGNPVFNTATKRNWNCELALKSWRPFLSLHSAKLISSERTPALSWMKK